MANFCEWANWANRASFEENSMERVSDPPGCGEGVFGERTCYPLTNLPFPSSLLTRSAASLPVMIDTGSPDGL